MCGVEGVLILKTEACIYTGHSLSRRKTSQEFDRMLNIIMNTVNSAPSNKYT